MLLEVAGLRRLRAGAGAAGRRPDGRRQRDRRAGRLERRGQDHPAARPVRAAHPRSTDFDRVLELFPQLAGRLDQVAGTLSGGEQQMCAIARGLMSRPALLMIDELSLGLAPLVIDEILARLPDIAAAGTAVLLVEQDVDAALSVSTRAYVLETGRIALSGLSRTLRTDPRIQHSYLDEPCTGGATSADRP